MNVQDIMVSIYTRTKKFVWNITTQRGIFIPLKTKTMLTIAMTVYKRTERTEKTIKSILENKAEKIELLVLLDKPCKNEITKMNELIERRNESDWSLQFYVQRNDKKITWLRNKAFELAKGENVFVINDDVEFSKNFDKIIQEHLENNVVNPVFRTPHEDGLRYKDNNISWHARAIKKSDREKIWKIDERLRLRYGDDFIFHNAIDHGLKIEWIEDVEVFHRFSKTLLNEKLKMEVELTKLQDVENRKTILKENWRFDFRFEQTWKNSTNITNCQSQGAEQPTKQT